MASISALGSSSEKSQATLQTQARSLPQLGIRVMFSVTGITRGYVSRYLQYLRAHTCRVIPLCLSLSAHQCLSPHPVSGSLSPTGQQLRHGRRRLELRGMTPPISRRGITTHTQSTQAGRVPFYSLSSDLGSSAVISSPSVCLQPVRRGARAADDTSNRRRPTIYIMDGGWRGAEMANGRTRLLVSADAMGPWPSAFLQRPLKLRVTL